MGGKIVLETKRVGDIAGDFFVPSYQRGYRWGEVEVTRLLEDVYQNGEKNYCLQPVVVAKREGHYELIDGQQRLTTIYLIYKYLSKVNPSFHEPAFSLDYQTRSGSAEFLKILDVSKEDENIDFWFISNAYKTIQKWFEIDNRENRSEEIHRSFKDHVKVIWYEVDGGEDPISLFTRLNIGKIPLTNAELVKAMFLSRDRRPKIEEEKQAEIALQWDLIERELHDESLWAFLTNSISSVYQTRIDLVLDLISGKDEATREKYYTFFKFDEMRKSVPLDEIWKKIYQTFLILKGWYTDHDLYHRIGYLIASGTSLEEIFALSENKRKSEFNECLSDLITESLRLPNNVNYADLSYENPIDYKRISRLLLLFNVESVRRMDGKAQRFPFDKFKHQKGHNITWSLEHIHAQQSEGMRTQEAWKEWIKIHIPSVLSLGDGHGDLVGEMRGALELKELDRVRFDEIHEKVVGLLSVPGNIEYMHSIGNLALLNTADNAALNNSTFDVKRNEIIKMDKEGNYIPYCTKMVFLKYYTPSSENQLHFWGEADRKAYVEAMNQILKDYIEPIVYLKEETK